MRSQIVVLQNLHEKQNLLVIKVHWSPFLWLQMMIGRDWEADKAHWIGQSHRVPARSSRKVLGRSERMHLQSQAPIPVLCEASIGTDWVVYVYSATFVTSSSAPFGSHLDPFLICEQNSLNLAGCLCLLANVDETLDVNHWSGPKLLYLGSRD